MNVPWQSDSLSRVSMKINSRSPFFEVRNKSLNSDENTKGISEFNNTTSAGKKIDWNTWKILNILRCVCYDSEDDCVSNNCAYKMRAGINHTYQLNQTFCVWI